jgi:hypothetical protein
MSRKITKRRLKDTRFKGENQAASARKEEISPFLEVKKQKTDLRKETG